MPVTPLPSAAKALKDLMGKRHLFGQKPPVFLPCLGSLCISPCLVTPFLSWGG